MLGFKSQFVKCDQASIFRLGKKERTGELLLLVGLRWTFLLKAVLTDRFYVKASALIYMLGREHCSVWLLWVLLHSGSRGFAWRQTKRVHHVTQMSICRSSLLTTTTTIEPRVVASNNEGNRDEYASQ